MDEQHKASELILNNDGSIYHLHLHPEDVADTIITVGDPDRVTLVSRYFDRIETKKQKREFITHTGYIGKKRITVISTGIGADNIDITLNELHLLKNYNFSENRFKTSPISLNIIRIGTSGCIQEDVPVDAFLVSSYGIGIDNVMHFYKFENTKEEEEILTRFKLHCYFHHTIHPYVFKGDVYLQTKFEKEFYSGITLTAPGFYAPQGRKVNLPISQEKFYEDIKSFKFAQHRITNIEMETAAMYGFSKLLGHKCLSLNVLLANRARGEFSKDPDKAVDGLIKKSLEIIEGV